MDLCTDRLYLDGTHVHMLIDDGGDKGTHVIAVADYLDICLLYFSSQLSSNEKLIGNDGDDDYDDIFGGACFICVVFLHK